MKFINKSNMRYIGVSLYDYIVLTLLFLLFPYTLALTMAIISANGNLQILIVNIYYIILISLINSDWFVELSRKLIHKHATDPTDDNYWNFIFERKFCRLLSYLAFLPSKTTLYSVYLMITLLSVLLDMKIISQLPFESFINANRYSIILLICVDRILSSYEKNKARKKKYKSVFENYTYK